MNVLIISDLHLTERKDDEYRWKIFEVVKDFATKNSIDKLFILGDLLDRKDRHPAELVNRLVDVLQELKKCFNEIVILKGNHDYLKPEDPFLAFLKHIPAFHWIDKPLVKEICGYKTLWLPHTKTPEEDWKDLDYKDVSYIFMHQSVIGCKVSNAYEMNHGLNLNFLTAKTKAQIYSGDIHVPQKIGQLTYIGTPHPVSFGDDYQPRMLWLYGKECKSIPINSIQRLSLRIQKSLDLEELKNKYKIKKGDQIKVKVELTNKELSSWTDMKETVKEWCRYNEVKLFDVALEKMELETITKEEKTIKKFETLHPLTALQRYAKQEGFDTFVLKTGEDLLKAVLQQEH